MTQRGDMGRAVGGGFRIGSSCTSMADSCQCMAKPIQYCKVKTHTHTHTHTHTQNQCCNGFSSVQSLSRVRPFATPWNAARQASLSITTSWSLLRLMSIESVMPSNHLILCHPLLLLPSVFPNIRVFSNESALHIMWPKYWSFRFSISPSNEYLGLISFRMDWLDLLAAQGPLRSLQCSMFLGSKITADGDCSHEIKRYLLLAMTNLESILLCQQRSV